MIIKSKKDLKYFKEHRNKYIDYLIFELNEFGVEGDYFEDFIDKIDAIQLFYENVFLKKNLEVQDKLRLSFWAFFSKLLMDRLGGELIIASKSDYSAGTPQLINYGSKYDKKGKKKWIGIGFNSWLDTHLLKKQNFTLKEKIEMLIKDYGNVLDGNVSN